MEKALMLFSAFVNVLCHAPGRLDINFQFLQLYENINSENRRSLIKNGKYTEFTQINFYKENKQTNKQKEQR